ncbi:MAG: hypothetical protein JKY19_11690 [Alcanivoracaceae bacterium]|nr:hypothetical protein [Alcanivoracaceae bacterium]
MAVISGFGYSIYLNLKLNDYMRTHEFIQLRFPDETLVFLESYDIIHDISNGDISYYDIIICELKSDMKYLNIDHSQAVNEMLYLENSEKNLLDTLKFKRDGLSEYLEDKEHINCREIGIKIQEIREAKNSQKPQSQYNFEN